MTVNWSSGKQRKYLTVTNWSSLLPTTVFDNKNVICHTMHCSGLLDDLFLSVIIKASMLKVLFCESRNAKCRFVECYYADNL